MHRHHAAIAIAALAFGTSARADAVPLIGTYVSADSQFVLRIDGADPTHGVIVGEYDAHYGPVGAFADKGKVGRYAWVENTQGGSGTAPFAIRFGGSQRPDGWPYVIEDIWNGAYVVGDSIVAEGSRAYVSKDGMVQVGSLGTQTFKLQR